MADLNNFQIYGLIGSATSEIYSQISSYTQAQLMGAQEASRSNNIMANATLSAQRAILNADFQATSLESDASMQAANIQAAADFQVSDITNSTLMMNAQAVIQADFNALIREEQEQDLWYQARTLENKAEMLEVNAELIRSQAEFNIGNRLKNLNQSMADMAVRAAAQGRSGATVDNLLRQTEHQVNRSIDIERLDSGIQQRNLQMQASQARTGAELSDLKAQSVGIMSDFEQRMVEIGTQYNSATAEAKTNFIMGSASTRASYLTTSANTKAEFAKNFAAIQSQGTIDAATIQADSISKQSDLAMNMAKSNAILGGISGLAKTSLTYGMIK